MTFAFNLAASKGTPLFRKQENWVKGNGFLLKKRKKRKKRILNSKDKTVIILSKVLYVLCIFLRVILRFSVSSLQFCRGFDFCKRSKASHLSLKKPAINNSVMCRNIPFSLRNPSVDATNEVTSVSEHACILSCILVDKHPHPVNLNKSDLVLFIYHSAGMHSMCGILPKREDAICVCVIRRGGNDKWWGAKGSPSNLSTWHFAIKVM